MARRFVLSFVIPNLIAILFVFSFPGKSVGGNIEFLLLLNSIFVVIVLFFAAICYCAFWLYGAKKRVEVDCRVNSPQVKWNSWFLIVLPLVGILLLAYDRIYLRGIDYTQSLRAARYEWLASEGGSMFGVVGNLFVPLGYVSIFFIFKYSSYISGWRSGLIIASSLVSVFGHAYLNGGRSNVFLYFVMVYIAYCISGRRFQFSSVLGGRGLLVCLFLFVSIFYVGSVTYSSAVIGDVDMRGLLRLAIFDMYGSPDENFFSRNHNFFVYFALYFALYLFHGQWTTQVIFELIDRPGYHSIVSAPTVFLDKLGWIDLGMDSRAFSDTGVFISLPGAIYYDFGWLGVLMIPVFLGFFFGLLLAYLRNNYWRGTLGILLVVTLPSILILSPVLPVYGFSYFSFIIFSFVFFAVFNLVLFRKTLYL